MNNISLGIYAFSSVKTRLCFSMAQGCRKRGPKLKQKMLKTKYLFDQEPQTLFPVVKQMSVLTKRHFWVLVYWLRFMLLTLIKWATIIILNFPANTQHLFIGNICWNNFATPLNMISLLNWIHIFNVDLMLCFIFETMLNLLWR